MRLKCVPVSQYSGNKENVNCSTGILMGFLCKTSTLISSTMLAYIVLYCCILLRRLMWMTSLWRLTSWITLVNEYPPIPRNHYNQSICRRVNWQLRKKSHATSTREAFLLFVSFYVTLFQVWCSCVFQV